MTADGAAERVQSLTLQIRRRDSENSIARTARDFCDKLFAIESELDKLKAEGRIKERLVQERPVFDAFWSSAEKAAPTVLEKSQLGKAF